MRIGDLEKELEKLSLEDLTELDSALGVACGKLPEPLILEMGLRSLKAVVHLIVIPKKKEGVDGEKRDSKV